MKRIAGLTAEPPGLACFRADPTAGQTWTHFRGAPKNELTDALSAIQHGLCAYCEIQLIVDDRQIEHFIPRGGSHGAPELALDFSNLLACCQGNTSVMFGSSALAPDPERVLPPNPNNLTCGQRKGDRPASGYLDPRRIPAQPSMFRIGPDGTIGIDTAACTEVATSEVIVQGHIDNLGLNTVRLRRGRAKVWNALQAALLDSATWPAHDRDSYLIRLAEWHLLPNAEGGLPRFFSTARSFFAETAEGILGRSPQTWI